MKDALYTHRGFAWIGFALALLLARSALAAPDGHAEVGLDYDRAIGTESCPVTDVLRADVAARLGYDPFVQKPEIDTIAVKIRRTTKGLEGTVTRLDGAHKPKGRPSTITSKSADCTELASALAVGMSIAIDPLSLTRSAPEPPAEPAKLVSPVMPVDVARLPATLAPARVPETKTVPVGFHLGVGPSIAAFALPAVSFGPRLLVGVAKGAFELDLEGRFDAPVTLFTHTGSVQASLVLGTLAPCARSAWGARAWALACAQISVGALRGTGLGFDHSREENTVYVAGGARAGIEVGISKTFGFRAMIEAQVPLRPTRLEADGAVLWTTPPLSLSLIPMLTGRFL